MKREIVGSWQSLVREKNRLNPATACQGYGCVRAMGTNQWQVASFDSTARFDRMNCRALITTERDGYVGKQLPVASRQLAE